jgi:hypothetical protein
MAIILTTPEQLEILIQKAISKTLDINTTASELPERFTLKEVFEIQVGKL